MTDYRAPRHQPDPETVYDLVPCDFCGQPVGQPCVGTSTRQPTAMPHPSRLTDYNRSVLAATHAKRNYDAVMRPECGDCEGTGWMEDPDEAPGGYAYRPFAVPDVVPCSTCKRVSYEAYMKARALNRHGELVASLHRQQQYGEEGKAAVTAMLDKLRKGWDPDDPAPPPE